MAIRIQCTKCNTIHHGGGCRCVTKADRAVTEAPEPLQKAPKKAAKAKKGVPVKVA